MNPHQRLLFFPGHSVVLFLLKQLEKENCDDMAAETGNNRFFRKPNAILWIATGMHQDSFWTAVALNVGTARFQAGNLGQTGVFLVSVQSDGLHLAGAGILEKKWLLCKSDTPGNTLNQTHTICHSLNNVDRWQAEAGVGNHSFVYEKVIHDICVYGWKNSTIGEEMVPVVFITKDNDNQTEEENGKDREAKESGGDDGVVLSIEEGTCGGV
ncbi:hypothetical protein FQN60_005684 [Etheostoma spectabile]|uniref:Uncharacterized protein n=1 Tax=Etheostoma spectabile TaxID=54343 RepID=A0A5J5CHY8_9PERO|nr:hypothetical protein FQN60_005684 [Etheostoma spectabile]